MSKYVKIKIDSSECYSDYEEKFDIASLAVSEIVDFIKFASCEAGKPSPRITGELKDRLNETFEHTLNGFDDVVYIDNSYDIETDDDYAEFEVSFTCHDGGDEWF